MKKKEIDEFVLKLKEAYFEQEREISNIIWEYIEEDIRKNPKTWKMNFERYERTFNDMDEAEKFINLIREKTYT